MGKKSLLFVFSIVVLLAAACAGGAPTPAPGATSASPPPNATSAKRVKLRMVMPSEPNSEKLTSVYEGTGSQEEPVIFNVKESLVDFTKDGPVPRLATKWESSPDLTKWRFYLRKGVKFHNGADFTARDVVEYAKWLIEVKDRSFIWLRVPMKEAVAVDDYTVDLIFETPQPLLLIRQRVLLIPPVAHSIDDRKMAGEFPLGTGPYKFEEWNKGQYFKLAKFDGYWGPKPQIDDVEITFRAEEGVRLAALLAGEADWVFALNPEFAGRAPKVVHMASPETVWLRFDESVQKEWTKEDPIFADKRLRLAVEYAIDRQKIVALYGGLITPSLGQFASPGEFGFNPDLKSRPYDLEKAKSLVREAGAVGKTVGFAGSTNRFSKDREAGEAIINMIEQTGLKVKPMLMSANEVQKYQRVLGEERQYMTDLFMGPSDALLEVESRFRPIFVAGQVHYALNDLEPARLYKEALAEGDFAKRGEKLGKAWAYVYEQAHYVPIYKLEWMWGLAKNLEWRLDIAGTPYIPDMRFTN